MDPKLLRASPSTKLKIRLRKRRIWLLMCHHDKWKWNTIQRIIRARYKDTETKEIRSVDKEKQIQLDS